MLSIGGKKNELLNLNLSEIEDLNETYDDYIDSSDEFDQYYKNFGTKKTLVVNKNIFNNIYETKMNNKQKYIKEVLNYKKN